MTLEELAGAFKEQLDRGDGADRAIMTELVEKLSSLAAREQAQRARMEKLESIQGQEVQENREARGCPGAVRNGGGTRGTPLPVRADPHGGAGAVGDVRAAESAGGTGMTSESMFGGNRSGVSREVVGV